MARWRSLDRFRRCVAAVTLMALPALAAAQAPHNQDKPPGPPLTPADAIALMKTPMGFQVKLFAAEPDVVNPVAMTFDARGRVWICESVEYPRRAPGKGKDRITILEDTDGDGRADKTTVFADGLNIPCGIVHGHGGVFVSNAPDILFLQDTDGDDRADRQEVVLTGFGRHDTHELPNSLIWGPDGWLYGLNGVFNHSSVANQGKTYEFTCAVWRYHPKRKKFELFAEGTSNPWGLDYDERGEWFVSACVIDHLWHLSESGYYLRQAGAYPPHAWRIPSIVQHKYFKAAYCGFCVYNGDAFPPNYAGRLIFGNIHDNSVLSDAAEPRGASYRAKPGGDLLRANHAWFMPVSQKVGPDGALWVLDWYDRYHCYQDANRDPKGIDRLKGRLYRLTYDDTPMAPKHNLSAKSSGELATMLGHPNGYYRRWARQILSERGDDEQLTLEKLALDPRSPMTTRMEAIWTMQSRSPLPGRVLDELLVFPDPLVRKWAIRAAVDHAGATTDEQKRRIATLGKDPAPEVRLQSAIAAGKHADFGGLDAILDAVETTDHDPAGLLPRIAWRNAEPMLARATPTQWDRLLAYGLTAQYGYAPEMLARAIDKALELPDARPAERLVAALLKVDRRFAKRAAPELNRVLRAAATGDLHPSVRAGLMKELADTDSQLAAIAADDPRRAAVLGFRLLLGHADAEPETLTMAVDPRTELAVRSVLLSTLLRTEAPDRLERTIEQLAPKLAANSGESTAARREILGALARVASPSLAPRLLAMHPKLEAELRPTVLDLLSSRPVWAAALLDAIEAKRFDARDVNVNQIRQIIGANVALAKRAAAIWGTVRMDRNPQREQLVTRYRRVLDSGSADERRGREVFKKVCAQCHKYFGDGHEVGPDITRNGRGSLDQILSNLLDPNLVIGKDYQARVVLTVDGRLVTGLVAEDSPARLVLKVAGGKLETFPRDQIEETKTSAVSLMPENLETQINEQEFRDLIAYLRREEPLAP